MKDLKPHLKSRVNTGPIEGFEPQRWLQRFRQWPRVGLVLMAVLAIALIHNSHSSLGLRVSIQEITSHGNHSRLEKGGAWSQIRNNDKIIWKRCYELYDCARLDVPLDWLDPSDTRRATLAIIRYNATSKEGYGGPVFINPGGPGGSGVFFVKHLGPYYQPVVGKNHDIVSFDPRGVGYTTPHISCWNANISETASFLWEQRQLPVLDAHPEMIYEVFATAASYSQQCASVIGDEGRFVSTTSTARDMLDIMEKIEGITFATLWPERIGRVVLDGNVDAAQLVTGNGTHFLADTDKVMASFFTYCHSARLENLSHNLKTKPVIVPSSTVSFIPTIVTYSDLRRLIAYSLYQPIVSFPRLATIISALELGDGQPYIDYISNGKANLPPCDESGQPALEQDGNADAGKAVLCSDTASFQGGPDEFYKYVKNLEKISKSAGATMASLRLDCVGWALEAKWKFAGPYQGNTSNPMLFLANTGDNVTPLVSAQENSNGFPGSIILTQDSYGHTTLSAPSRCTTQAIRRYFQFGTLPLPNTTCAPDITPFQPWNSSFANFKGATKSFLENYGPWPRIEDASIIENSQ